MRIKGIAAITAFSILAGCLCGCSPAKSTEDSDTPVVKPHASPVNTVDATLNNPAKLGEWVLTSDTALSNDKYYQCYCRVTGIYIGDEALPYIERNNEDPLFDNTEDRWADEGLTDDYEYVVICYDWLYPEEFPTKDEGMIGIVLPDFDLHRADGVELKYDDEYFYITELVRHDDGIAQAGRVYSSMEALAVRKDCEDFALLSVFYSPVSDNDVCEYRYIDPWSES